MKKTNRITGVILALFLIMNTFTVVSANANDIKVIVDGQQIVFDVQPQIIDGRTMVPMRKIFEELGMSVEWFNETQTVMAVKRGVVVEFPIGSTIVWRNMIEQTIDVPAQIVDGRTLVPVRFVSEFVGAEVVWDGNASTVFINSTDCIKEIDWNDDYEYCGEVENGEAVGYGALYKKDDGSLSQLGKYVDSQIIEGYTLYDSGDTFNGIYKNGEIAYGRYSYGDGDLYDGEFFNGVKHGTGTYYYSDGSYHVGEWENDYMHGYGLSYDAVENVQYEGNYTNGQANGQFVITDFNLNVSYYATYVNGVYFDENQEILNELYKELDKFYEEYAELEAWLYSEKVRVETDFLNYVNNEVTKNYQEFYREALNEAAATGRSAGWITSTVNQKMEQYRQYLMSNKQAYINQQNQYIENEYAQKKINLDRQKEILLAEIYKLENQ